MDIDLHLRRRSHMYFGEEGPSARAIAQSIASGASILGAKQTKICSAGQWTLVGADIDWLYKGRFPEHGKSIWDAPYAFPERSVNDCRYEVMVRVFSHRAFTWLDGKFEVIVGEMPKTEEISSFDGCISIWKRGVAFEFSAA